MTMTRAKTWRRAAALGLGLGVAGLVVGSAAGCRGDRTDKPPRRFFPDMDNQQKWDAQEETEFFANGRTAREPVPNAVPFGRAIYGEDALEDEDWASTYRAERVAMLAEDDATFRGVNADGETYADYIPIEVTRELIEVGQERFNIYCAACHGFTGDGNGMAGTYWSYPVTNIVTGVYADRSEDKGKDGYLFHVIREGVWGPDGANRMPGYKHAVSEEQAWAIVAYLRSMQMAASAPASMLSPAEREILEAQRGPVIAAPGGGGASEGADAETDGSDEESGAEGGAS